MTNFNQKRAEKPFNDFQILVMKQWILKEKRSLLKRWWKVLTRPHQWQSNRKLLRWNWHTKARLEDEPKENKEKQESPFWSKTPIIDKFFGKKESPSLRSESSPAVSNKEEIGSVATNENKEQVIFLKQSAAQTNVEGDNRQSEPEDKDMYPTPSWKTVQTCIFFLSFQLRPVSPKTFSGPKNHP